jgi:hypothetical protein
MNYILTRGPGELRFPTSDGRSPFSEWETEQEAQEAITRRKRNVPGGLTWSNWKGMYEKSCAKTNEGIRLMRKEGLGVLSMGLGNGEEGKERWIEEEIWEVEGQEDDGEGEDSDEEDDDRRARGESVSEKDEGLLVEEPDDYAEEGEEDEENMVPDQSGDITIGSAMEVEESRAREGSNLPSIKIDEDENSLRSQGLKDPSRSTSIQPPLDSRRQSSVYSSSKAGQSLPAHTQTQLEVDNQPSFSQPKKRRRLLSPPRGRFDFFTNVPHVKQSTQFAWSKLEKLDRYPKFDWDTMDPEAQISYERRQRLEKLAGKVGLSTFEVVKVIDDKEEDPMRWAVPGMWRFR